jgi:2-keto-4-pentenoate hydratase
MMERSRQQTADADRLLRGLWQRGEVCERLPDRFAPQSKEEAYAIQALIEQGSQFPLAAWKIAATSIAGQKHIGVSGPLAGRYITEQMVGDGGTIPLGQNRMRVAEIEFAFRFGDDILPRIHPYAEEEIFAHVAALHPAIEIPDSRYAAFEKVGELHLIADNACACWLCLGAAFADEWRTTDLAAFQPVGKIRGKPDVVGLGRNVLGGPCIALTWFVNEMSALGVTLRAGQYVTTGTCLVPMVIGPGDHITGDFGTLGRVSVSLT